MRILLIVNPAAGRRSRRDVAGEAAAILRSGGWEVALRETAGPDATRTLAREGAAEGFDAVFACGGDGTLSDVVGGLLDTGVPAGIIPAGTGNDFARTLGVPLDPAAAAASYLTGRAGPLDLLCVDRGRLWAINVVGVGFDARVARRVNARSRITGGLLAYLTGVAVELAANRPTIVRVTVDGERWEGPVLLVAVANARSYGAGMMIAPQARTDDGLLDLVVVEHLSRTAFAVNFPKVMRGTHLSLPVVHSWRASSITIETDEPSPVLVDGDLKGETPLVVEVAPGRGSIWRPGSQNNSQGG